MRNRFLKSLFAASAACFLLLMSGCNSAPVAGTPIALDSKECDMGDFLLRGEEPRCVPEGDYYSLEVSLQIINKKQNTASYHFEDPFLQDEILGDEYKVTIQNDKLTADPWTAGNISFSSAIPSSITTQNYKLSFEMNSDSTRFRFDYFLHNIYSSRTPGQTRTPDVCMICDGETICCPEGPFKVNYYVSGTLVKTVDYEGCTCGTYVYESSDRLWYCDKWYANEEKTEQVTHIGSNLNLYGDASPCFCWDLVSNPNYSTLTKVNHVPYDGKIVIPRYYENKEIIIGNSAINNLDFLDIYIPITVRRIEDGNFEILYGKGPVVMRYAIYIYYEGSEEEWNSICYGEISNRRLVFVFMNHSDYPY